MSKPSPWMLDAGLKPEPIFEIREVHYSKDDEIQAWTETAIAPYGSSLEELKADTELMVRAFDKPVLDLDELEKKIAAKSSESLEHLYEQKTKQTLKQRTDKEPQT